MYIVRSIYYYIGGNGSIARSNSSFIEIVQTLEPEKTGITYPSGLSFSYNANLFYVVEANPETVNGFKYICNQKCICLGGSCWFNPVEFLS